MSYRILYGWLVVWPSLWITIAASVAGILTGGYYVPSWDTRFMYWSALYSPWAKWLRGRQ